MAVDWNDPTINELRRRNHDLQTRVAAVELWQQLATPKIDDIEQNTKDIRHLLTQEEIAAIRLKNHALAVRRQWSIWDRLLVAAVAAVQLATFAFVALSHA